MNLFQTNGELLLPPAASKVEYEARTKGWSLDITLNWLIEGPVLTASSPQHGLNQKTPVNGDHGLEQGKGLLNTDEFQAKWRARDSGSRWNHSPAPS